MHRVALRGGWDKASEWRVHLLQFAFFMQSTKSCQVSGLICRPSRMASAKPDHVVGNSKTTKSVKWSHSHTTAPLPPSCVVQPCVLHVLVSSSQNLHSKAVVQPASLALAGCPTHLPVVLVPCLSGTVMLIGVCVPLTLISLPPCLSENEMSELASVTFVSPVAGSEVAADTGGAPRKLTALL